jgi:hypothetical protein
MTEKSHIMRPGEHDKCIGKLCTHSLKKLHNHHLEMSKQVERPGGAEHHEKLAHAYKTIIESIKSGANIR